ncbi:MAG: hypothetical protein ABL902_00145 [Gallionella sp.]|nr:hypothetical protein [Gallionella sp.]
MKQPFTLVILTSTLLCACAETPEHTPSSSEYAANCRYAERRKSFNVAEQACSMALSTNDWGDNSKVRSQHLYNLGRIKLRLTKFSEAELLLKESLQIEEVLASPPKTIGYRLVDLSESMASQNKWLEGTPFLERVIPIAPQYSKQERDRIGQLLFQYSQHLKLNNQSALAKKFKTTSALIIDNDTYTFRN